MTRRIPIATTLFLLVLAPLAAQTYKNTLAGFALNPPDKWIATPVAPDEPETASKWVSKNPIKDTQAEFVVMLFEKAAKKKPESAASRPGSKPVYAGNSGSSYEKFCSEGFSLRSRFKFDKPREVKVKGTTAKARVYDMVVPKVWQRGAEELGAWFGIAIIDTPERQFALEMFAAEGAREKLAPIFLEIVKSFRALDESQIEDDDAIVAGLSEKEKAKRTAELTKRQVPGWWYKESAHYVILTNIKPERADMIDQIRTRIEHIRKVYEKDFPAPKPIEAVSIVRVCATQKEYHAYGGPPSTGGYWNKNAEELVLFAGIAKNAILGTLMHEAFHQYIYYCFGELAPHSWYNEGFGDYYSGGEPDGSLMVIKPDRGRYDLIKGAIAAKAYVPIDKIIHYTQHEYYSNPGLCYAEGWSLVWFLNKGLPKSHPWRSILPTYFDWIRETKDPKRAVEAAFKGVDFEAFEQAWAQFITKEIPAPMPR